MESLRGENPSGTAARPVAIYAQPAAAAPVGLGPGARDNNTTSSRRRCRSFWQSASLKCSQIRRTHDETTTAIQLHYITRPPLYQTPLHSATLPPIQSATKLSFLRPPSRQFIAPSGPICAPCTKPSPRRPSPPSPSPSRLGRARRTWRGRPTSILRIGATRRQSADRSVALRCPPRFGKEVFLVFSPFPVLRRPSASSSLVNPLPVSASPFSQPHFI